MSQLKGDRKPQNFRESLEIGFRGEDIVLRYLENKFPYSDIVSVRDIDYYKNIDVDAIIGNPIDGGAEFIEIKYDTTNYDCCNMFIEIVSSEKFNTPGWLFKTKADYIAYAFSERNCLIMCKTDDLKRLVAINEYKKAKAHDDNNKVSIGYLIPIQDVIRVINRYKDDYRFYDKEADMK